MISHPDRRFYRIFVFALFLAALCHGFSAFSAPTAMASKAASVDVGPHGQFAAHKALYEIKLTGTKSGSQIVNVSGQMLYEWQPTCDAWISNHKFNLYYEYADSPAMHIASDFSTYEPFDGQSIDFTSQRRRDQELVDEMRGSATLQKDGSGAATYTIPAGLEYDLPKGSMFPLMHTKNVLEAIRAGKKFYSAVVFDGSDEDGPAQISAVIGPIKDIPESIKKSRSISAELLKSPAHEIRMAFFPLSDSSESADYEMTILFHENGIISDMAIDYDDFSISQRLIALEPLPDSCAARKKNH